MTGASGMRPLSRLLLLGACAGLLALPACGRGSASGGMFSNNRQAYDGQYFRARLSADKEARELFSVRVNDAAKSLVGAREAGRHEAVKYCIQQYGQSRINWTTGPDVEDGALVFEDGDLILAGECLGW